MRQTRGDRKIQYPVLKTRFKTKETTATLVSEKYLVVSFWSLSIMAFSMFFIEDYLRKLEKSKIKNRFGLNAPKLSKNRRFFSKDKIVLGKIHYKKLSKPSSSLQKVF
jgi:hypothetical protein